MVDPLDRFLRLIFPWDDQYASLYKSVMWRFLPPAGQDSKPGQKPLANYAAQSFEELKRLIISRKDRVQHDMWICLGTQRMADTATSSRDGFAKANRTKPNIVSLKSIWLDIDVKGAGYADVAEAAAGLQDFLTKSQLPRPTMIVKSGGGGFHVYWVTDEPMAVPAWEALAINLRDTAQALGLKFDPAVTIDAARVLRIPDTRNWKYDPVARVELVEPDDDYYPVYTYQDLAHALRVHAGAVAGMRTTPTMPRSSVNQNLMAGVTTAAPPIPLADIATNCAQVAATIASGGNGDPEPLWNSMVLLSTFTDDPRPNAHKLSSGDPRYTAAETDRKFDEKELAKAQGNVGWPSCISISQYGSHCKTCPLLVQGKSPLNHAARHLNPQQPPPGQKAEVPTDKRLIPHPYWQDPRDHVYLNRAGENGNPEAVDLFEYPILEAAIDREHERLAIKTRISSVEVWGSISVNAHHNTGQLIKEFASFPWGGLHIPQNKRNLVRDFVVSWIAHLQTNKRHIAASAYGWTAGSNSFCFGDTLFTDKGRESVYLGKTHDTRYKEEGALKPWQDAMKLVYGNTPLETIVASSFGAPIIQLFAEENAILSVYSAASGVGKTTALKLAQSVWGHPRTGISALDDTHNSVMQKVKDLRSLPIYWDELITREAVDKVVGLIFAFTQGKGKSRLNRDAQQMGTSGYTTLFCLASNHGVGNKIYSGTNGTEAGGLRIFEIEIAPMQNPITSATASKLQIALQENYGNAGGMFAFSLVKNRKTVTAIANKVEADFEKLHKFAPKERFWKTTMVAIYTGALVANHFGLTNFNLKAMELFLHQSFRNQRNKLALKEDDTLSSSQGAAALLDQMLQEHRATSVVITDTIPVLGLRGFPQPMAIRNFDVTRLGNIWIQVGQQDGRIRLRQREFHQWLAKAGHNYDHVMDLLSKEYRVVIGRGAIGAGTSLSIGNGTRPHVVDLTPISSSGSSHDSP